MLATRNLKTCRVCRLYAYVTSRTPSVCGALFHAFIAMFFSFLENRLTASQIFPDASVCKSATKLKFREVGALKECRYDQFD